MRNIIIVDAISTGYNYVEDVIRRGYNPVVLETAKVLTPEVEEIYRAAAASWYHQPEIIREGESFEETAEMVKSYDPVLILPGTEQGVVLSTKLSAALGLPGNPVEYIDAMTKKDAMHKALADAGIRYIRGKKVTSPAEAVSFCRENGLTSAVVKPLESAGSQGLFLCADIKEVEEAVKNLLGTKDLFGKSIHTVLVQERIYGVEYIVNTISSGGRHRVSSILRYRKEKTAEGGYIYDYMEYVNRLESGHNRLVEYAFQVADAIHYQNGVIHGEYMIDEKGPVLIEVNCRPMGLSQPAEYMDLIMGQHETDSVLDALLYPETFEEKRKEPYRLLRKGYIKMIMVPKEVESEDYPIWEVAKQLKSVYKISAHDPQTVAFLPKTRDLETNGGIIYMVHDDEDVVEADLALLRRTEKKYFNFLISDGMSRRWFIDTAVNAPDFSRIIRDCGCTGAVLVAADEQTEITGAQCISPESISEAHKGFDFVIMGYQKALLQLPESKCLRLVFNTMDLAKNGGKVIIPESTWHYLSYGREGAEGLLLMKGFAVEAPLSGESGKVIGTNEQI